MTDVTDNRGRPRRSNLLTTTQSAIVELIAIGRTDKEIAFVVGISYRTVRTHLERLYDANGVHCRAALVAVLMARRGPFQEGEKHED